MTPSLRLLAIDIDGTLLDSAYQLPAANITALRHAHEEGIEVVLGTGRRHTFALPIAQQLGFPTWLMSSNGAVTKSSSGETFHRDLLPQATALKICTHMRDFRGNTVLTFDRDGKGALVLESIEELSNSIARWLDMNEQYIHFEKPIENALTTDPVQVMFSGNVERMQQAIEQLSGGGFSDEITVMKTQYDGRDLCIVDVLNHKCSKGHALRRWARHRGIAAEEIMAIGDNFNDVAMLQFAGMPVIMGNACEELKRNQGWMVTGSNDEAGVAMAVERALSGRLQAIGIGH